MRISPAYLSLFALLFLCSCNTSETEEPLSTAQNPLETVEELEDAIELHLRFRGEQLIIATDGNERYNTLVGSAPIEILQESGDLEQLFQIGDEAFEAERDRRSGAGVGAPPRTQSLPVRPQRIQTGELGGLDSSSCRSCHFSGGPDGAGSATQAALFRGDGVRLSTSTVRDPPHIMGLGYITLVAREMEVDLRRQRDLAKRDAEALDQAITVSLNSKGIDFGTLIANPDGSFDTSQLTAISSDLKIRPFGHKGRHADLVELADEALQLHHGLQSTSRIETWSDTDDAETYLGAGSPVDPDDDGVIREIVEAQAVLLGGYMSMLPIPDIRPPENPELAFIWASGRRQFDAAGCANCHTPELRFLSYTTELTATGTSDLSLLLDLEIHGQEPIPRRTDFGADDDGRVPAGVPIFPFTDLRRHDMGPELAEPMPEILPDAVDPVPGSVWLTRSLWGLADTAPYLHDGRAPTVHDAILLHGGEAAESRDAYVALTDKEQGALRMFLMSLTRPPTLLVE